MDLDEVEAIVDDATRRAGALFTRSSRKGRYVDVEIHLLSPHGPGAAAGAARVWTCGVEAFFLDLPGGFTYRDFDHERDAQVAILRLMVALAGEHLLARSQQREELDRFGRRQRYLEITVDGKAYWLSQRARWVSTRGGRR